MYRPKDLWDIYGPAQNPNAVLAWKENFGETHVRQALKPVIPNVM